MVVELRELLVHANISFSTEIANHQEGITDGLTKLVDIIANILNFGFKPSNYVQLSLIPPSTLILQIIESTLSSVGSISSVFQSLNIPTDPYFFLQEYVPHIDWDSFKKHADEYALLTKTKMEMEGGEGGGY